MKRITTGSDKFELPEVCIDIAGSFDEIIKGYSELLDGQIDYGKTHYRAIHFFGNKDAKVTMDDIKLARGNIDKKLEFIETLYEEILNADLPSITLKEIYLSALEEYKNKFLMLYHAIPIEAEKGGYLLDETEKELCIQKSKTYNHAVRGAPVSENTHEVKRVMNSVEDLYAKKKESLKPEEQVSFSAFLSQTEQKYTYTPSSLGIGGGKIQTKKDKKNEKLLKEIFGPNQQKKIFEGLLHAESSMHAPDGAGWSIKLDHDKGSVSTDQYDESIAIPGSTKDKAGNIINHISISKILATFTHEFGKHGISGMNANKFFGKGFKGKGYLAIEEGLARIFEMITTGKVKTLKDLDGLVTDPGITMITVFLAEQYPGDEAVKLLHAYRKMSADDPSKVFFEDSIYSIKRRKRFVPWDQPGASTKDLSYMRGLMQVIYALQETGSTQGMFNLMQDINFAKLGLDDIRKVPQLRKELGIHDEHINTTTFMARRVFELVRDKRGDKKTSETRVDDLINAIPLTKKAQQIVVRLSKKIKQALKAA